MCSSLLMSLPLANEGTGQGLWVPPTHYDPPTGRSLEKPLAVVPLGVQFAFKGLAVFDLFTRVSSLS